MPALPKELEDEVMKLPVLLRAQLAQQLIASLDQEPADADAELLWIAEAQRRAEEFSTGAVEGIPADEALEGARNAAVTDIVFHPLAELFVIALMHLRRRPGYWRRRVRDST